MKTLVTIGTRPEAIKMAPVITALRATPGAEVTVCLTGQHPEMAGDALAQFDIAGDHTLEIDPGETGLPARFAAIHKSTAGILRSGYDWVLVHGDTTSTFAATLAGYHTATPVGHVEAGLRTGDISSPWPEEGYRRLVGGIAAVHFAPTERARMNLLREAVAPETIAVTGNTIVDALQDMRDRMAADEAGYRKLTQWRDGLTGGRPHILVTAHRRENQGAPMRRIATAVARLATANPGTAFLLPVHPNPEVSGPLCTALADLRNVVLMSPLAYREFVFLMHSATLILSDSGGIQEEAPTFGVPVLVMRDSTERPEAVDAGCATLVGTDVSRIITGVSRHLMRQATGRDQPRIGNPFGDGRAALRIAEHLMSGEKVQPIRQEAGVHA